MLKREFLTACALSASAPLAWAATPMQVTGIKLKLFDGVSYPSMANFFTTYSGTSLALKYADKNGNLLAKNPDWLASGYPVPSRNGLYAGVPDGQCVAFAKAASGTTGVASTSWRQGDHVVDYWDPNVLVGKVMATFTGGRYDGGHVAVILSAWKAPGSNTVTNVWVVDQNFVPANGLTIAKHEINKQGSGYPSSLSNYYLVNY